MEIYFKQSKKKREKIDFILNYISLGYNKQQIIKKVRSNYKCSVQTAYNNYNLAEEVLLQDDIQNIEKRIKKINYRLRKLYQYALLNNDYKECHNILKTEMELFGIKNVTQIIEDNREVNYIDVHAEILKDVMPEIQEEVKELENIGQEKSN